MSSRCFYVKAEEAVLPPGGGPSLTPVGVLWVSRTQERGSPRARGPSSPQTRFYLRAGESASADEFTQRGSGEGRRRRHPHSPALLLRSGGSAAVLFIAGDSHTLPFRPTPGVVILALKSPWRLATCQNAARRMCGM